MRPLRRDSGNQGRTIDRSPHFTPLSNEDVRRVAAQVRSKKMFPAQLVQQWAMSIVEANALIKRYSA